MQLKKNKQMQLRLKKQKTLSGFWRTFPVVTSDKTMDLLNS